MSEEEMMEEFVDEDEEKLPFAKAEVVRLMKENLDDDKMIRERVKVEMNKFLGDVLKNVCKQLNDYPYTTIEYEMLKESTYPYTNIERINQEKERILLHLEAIKADCNALAMDVQKTLKLKDVVEKIIFLCFPSIIGPLNVVLNLYDICVNLVYIFFNPMTYRYSST